MFAHWSPVIILVLVRLQLARAISPISIKGAKLFTNDGSQFYVKGVAYSRQSTSTVTDVLLDTDQCEIDAGLMKDIGVNTIRVYTVDTTGNHDGCMATFASQGIYVWLDLQTPLISINRADPAYTLEMFNRFAAVIDTFAKYDNTLAFNAGNEVINDPSTTDTAPYLKAIVRDARAYRDARGYRQIPVSYTSADVPSLQLPTMDYLACGDQEDTIEMFGMNDYTWCGNSSYLASGYAKVYTQFQHINIPVLFAEVGCISNGPRSFGEVAAILGSVFPATFSGAIVYEWAEEGNGYGLVEYSNSAQTGFPSPLVDYTNLGTVYGSATPVSTSWTAYTPTNTPPGCPPINSNWKVTGSASIPTIAQLNIETVTARTTYESALHGAKTSRGSSTTTTGVSTTATSRNSMSGDRKQRTESLSTGAIAGIAIAGVAVVLGLVLVSFFVLRRRRKARKPMSKDVNENAHDYQKAELPVTSATRSELDPNNFHAKRELDSNPVHATHELGRQSPVWEMPGSRPNVNELPSKGSKNA